MKFLILLSILCFITLVQSFSLTQNAEEHVLKLKDLLDQLKEGVEISEFKVGDKVLKLKYFGKQTTAPVFLYDGTGKPEAISVSSEHKLYHDDKNHATLTLSTFVDEDGVRRKHLRGSILEHGSETVIEPHQSTVSKRSVDTEADVVRVYKKPLEGRLPGKHDGLHLNRIQKAKRQSSLVQAYVETLVICDFSCYNQHAAYVKSTVKTEVANYIEGYLAHVMNLADLHYQRSFEKDTQLKISLITKSYVILTTSAASKFTTDPSTFMTVNGKSTDSINRQYVNGDVSLSRFNDWLVEQRDGNTIPTFDIAVAFVNSNLFTPSADLLGIAPMAGTCSIGRNGVLVEDSGNFASGSTTAHEVAHNLAVDHDVNSGSSACTDEMNYVMSTSNKLTNRVNSFYFSSCSINSLKKSFLVSNLFPCTTNALARGADYQKFISFYPGQLTNANEQCQRALGSNYKLMLGNKAGGGTFEGEVCSVLWCTTDYNSATSAGYASEGTSCGDGKWCIKGECVADSAAPKGQCLVEDDTVFCNDFLSKYGMLNVCNNFKTGRCCKMCGGTLIPRLSGYDMTTFLSGNTLDNVKLLDTVYTAPCADKQTWCTVYVPQWKLTTPDICSGSYSVNGEPINTACKKTCNLC